MMIHYLIDQSVTKTIVAGNKTITALFTVSFALEVYIRRTDQ